MGRKEGRREEGGKEERREEEGREAGVTAEERRHQYTQSVGRY